MALVALFGSNEWYLQESKEIISHLFEMMVSKLVTCALLSLTLLVIYILSTVIYNLLFHPLAGYPGPFLAKFTNWYAVYYSYRQEYHIDVYRCHEKYGNIVRYGPNRLLFNTSGGLKDIYGHQKNIKKARQYKAFGRNTFSVADKTLHAWKRRAMKQGLTDAAFKDYESIILKKRDIFCSLLAGDSSIAGPGNTFDMGKWTKYLTFDIISNLAFGAEPHMIERPHNRYVTEAFSRSNRGAGIAGQYPSMMNLISRYLRLTTDIEHCVNTMLETIDTMAKERAQRNDSDRMDLFSAVMASKDPETGQSFSVDEMNMEMALVMTAGSDSSAVALSATFFYLSRNQSAYQAVTKEVRTAFSSLAAIRSSPALSSCHYLRACIDEALRLCPPVSGAQWREVEYGGAKIDNHFVPAGVDVAVGAYAIHRNPAYYPEPFSYRPERWLEDGPELTAAQAAFCPFSIGPRGCTGKYLAYRIIYIVLASVLFAFEFELAEGEAGKLGEGQPGTGIGKDRIEEFQIRDQWTSAVSGPVLAFKKRDGVTL
ncbi:cytochrome P450 [Xylogone sp. PMI_703]|nr:cytochrome P450 [Xylogone sp. PMI_703]